MIQSEPAKASPTAVGREDFIKRLFAVTLSVGVANQLSHVMLDPNAVVHNHILLHPIIARWRELLLLLISLAVVVSSWEGYLRAVLANPLEDIGRFIVDILLVFSYLLMTLATEDADVWFGIHVAIYLEYTAWDILRKRLPTYMPRQNSHESSLIITVIWLAYFSAIFLFKTSSPYFETTVGYLSISLAVLAGVFLYRIDKKHRAGWTWPIKVSVILGLIGTLAALSLLDLGHGSLG